MLIPLCPSAKKEVNSRKIRTLNQIRVTVHKKKKKKREPSKAFQLISYTF